MSLAVVYRSEARFDSAFRQIRSSSFGIVSSIWRGGRASVVVICSSSSSVRVGPERSPPGQQLVEDHAQAEDVRAAIDPVPLATGLLGTHVGGRPGESRPLAEVLLPRASPKSATNGLPAASMQDVGGLDVPVDQPLRWAWCSASATVATSSTASRKDGRASSILCRQVAALDVLRDDVAEAVVGAAHVMDRHDVRVVEVGEDAGFGQVGFGVLGAGDALRVRHLDGHGAVNCSSWAR